MTATPERRQIGDLVQLKIKLRTDGQPSRALVTAVVTTRQGVKTYAPGSGLVDRGDCYAMSYSCTEPGPVVVRVEGGGAFSEIKFFVQPSVADAPAQSTSQVTAAATLEVPDFNREEAIAYLRELGVPVGDSRSDAFVAGAVRASRGRNRDAYLDRTRDAWRRR